MQKIKIINPRKSCQKRHNYIGYQEILCILNIFNPIKSWSFGSKRQMEGGENSLPRPFYVKSVI